MLTSVYTLARLGTGPDMSDSLATIINRFHAEDDGCWERKKRKRRGWGLKGDWCQQGRSGGGHRRQLSGKGKKKNLNLICNDNQEIVMQQ